MLDAFLAEHVTNLRRLELLGRSRPRDDFEAKWLNRAQEVAHDEIRGKRPKVKSTKKWRFTYELIGRTREDVLTEATERGVRFIDVVAEAVLLKFGYTPERHLMRRTDPRKGPLRVCVLEPTADGGWRVIRALTQSQVREAFAE